MRSVGSLGYTAVGEQVGMAQRMESVAPPGGVMLSASTARLVDGAAALGEPEMVRIKGAEEPVAAQRLLGMAERHRGVGRADRIWWVGGGRCPRSRACWTVRSMVTARWSAWSVRLVSGKAVWCARFGHGRRGVDVFIAFCESHTSQVPFHAVARLLRAAPELRVWTRRSPGIDCATGSDADPEDLLLFDDLLGIADPDMVLPRSIRMRVGGG